MSEDLDFFCERQIEPAELASLATSFKTKTRSVEIEVVGPRTSIVLVQRRTYVGRIDFAFYPFDPVGRRTKWKNLVVDSIEDMTVNKVQAVLTREQPRDFVDLYFLLREGPLRDLDRILDHVRAKFDAGPHRLGLAQRLLAIRSVKELPRMIRRVTHRELVAFFEDRARELVRME